MNFLIFRTELKKLHEDKKDSEKLILNLQKESQNAGLTVSKNEATIQHLTTKCNNKKKTIHGLRFQYAQLVM